MIDEPEEDFDFEEWEGESDPEGHAQFEALVAQIRRWILGLGLSALLVLFALGLGRPVLLGFCTGWLLSLFSLDHLAHKARQVRDGALGPAGARSSFVSHYFLRWSVTIVVVVLAVKLGADPVAAVVSLLLLQAAIVCCSMKNLLTGAAPAPGGDGDQDPDPETTG